jgi:hypothetical protein
VADAGGAVQVGPERRLAVGSRRDEVEPPARAEEAGTEAGHDVSSLVFEGHRWHRDEDVGGQQGHQRVEIGGLPARTNLATIASSEGESEAGGGARSAVDPVAGWRGPV